MLHLLLVSVDLQIENDDVHEDVGVQGQNLLQEYHVLD